jgi:hypothetical protein
MDCECAEIAYYMATTNSQDEQPGRILREKLQAPDPPEATRQSARLIVRLQAPLLSGRRGGGRSG